MSQEENYDKELAELLEGLSPEFIRRVLDQTQITKGDKEKVERVQGSVFRTITRNNTCLHCGATWQRRSAFARGETFVVMNEKGKHYCVTVKEHASIEVYNNYCNSCEGYIRRLPRAELEQRYLKLLKICGHELLTKSQKEKRRLCQTTRTDIDNLPNV